MEPVRIYPCGNAGKYIRKEKSGCVKEEEEKLHTRGFFFVHYLWNYYQTRALPLLVQVHRLTLLFLFLSGIGWASCQKKTKPPLSSETVHTEFQLRQFGTIFAGSVAGHVAHPPVRNERRRRSEKTGRCD